MHGGDVSDTTPIGARSELVEWIAQARSRVILAARHRTREGSILYSRFSPVPYDGGRGIRALLEGLQERTGWVPIIEGDHPIGLADEEVVERSR